MAAVQVEDLVAVEGDFVVRLGRSKPNQEGRERWAPLVGAAAEAVRLWMARSGVRTGFLFRAVVGDGAADGRLSNKAVNRIVKARARPAGLDPSEFGAHSLRSRFVTEAGRQGVSRAKGMALTGHRSESVYEGCHQAGEVLRNRASRLFEK